MTANLYLSLMPEALIASMLNPQEFGRYYAVGAHRKLRGQAMFIELDPAFRNDAFRIDEGIARCVAHKDGRPKKSVYISVYRILEHVPLEAMKRLHLVTAYGETLGLERQDTLPADEDRLHLYQEIVPVQPLVASTFGPRSFSNFITQDPESLVHLPAIAFVELQLGALAEDPEMGPIGNLPYDYIPHLRECLIELENKTIHNKMVHRVHAVEFPYRMIKNGIYIGNSDGIVCFPLPSLDELRGTYYQWWRSANS